MKKILIVLLLLLLVGCEKDMNNTPTKRVEVFLSSYQSITEEVEAKIITDVEEMDSLTKEEQDAYIELWKKHYRGLTYEIKDEKIDGDNAIVETEIEVYDYSDIMNATSEYLSKNPEVFQDENGEHSYQKFNDYRLSELKKADSKVKYTIDFKLKKVNDKWILGDLNEEENLKLSGMFNH